MTDPKILLDKSDMERAISRIAHEIIENNKGVVDVCLIGIQRGGVHMARRLSDRIDLIEGQKVQVGTLDIAMYRDDLDIRDEQPRIRRTDVPFDINGKVVILVDDVFFTGRSIRAAMDALMDIGRPAVIQLAVLIDRGHRELPIRADYAGKNIPTSKNETIEVVFKEDAGKDEVILKRSEGEE
ncbi:MAG: bifunctional pyr operon transcriptional regulator/uracil phosphoribosyltransferase PyrR [Nitrospirota bacterium]|nr:MAG: bifunctional pyr operon transcriptional regulator/uracil phosphoribosyltransferase PyrR [Nitrospirota bacterium]